MTRAIVEGQQGGAPEAFEQHLEEGGALLSAGRLDEALGHLEAAHALQPANDTAQNLLGLCCFKLGHLDRAAEIYELLVRDNPADATLRVNLGLVYLKANALQRAVREFETATDLAPDHRRAHNYLGLALAQAGEYGRAREHFVLAGSEHMAERMARALDGAGFEPGSTPAGGTLVVRARPSQVPAPAEFGPRSALDDSFASPVPTAEVVAEVPVDVGSALPPLEEAPPPAGMAHWSTPAPVEGGAFAAQDDGSRVPGAAGPGAEVEGDEGWDEDWNLDPVGGPEAVSTAPDGGPVASLRPARLEDSWGAQFGLEGEAPTGNDQGEPAEELVVELHADDEEPAPVADTLDFEGAVSGASGEDEGFAPAGVLAAEEDQGPDDGRYAGHGPLSEDAYASGDGSLSDNAYASGDGALSGDAYASGDGSLSGDAYASGDGSLSGDALSASETLVPGDADLEAGWIDGGDDGWEVQAGDPAAEPSTDVATSHGGGQVVPGLSHANGAWHGEMQGLQPAPAESWPGQEMPEGGWQGGEPDAVDAPLVASAQAATWADAPPSAPALEDPGMDTWEGFDEDGSQREAPRTHGFESSPGSAEVGSALDDDFASEPTRRPTYVPPAAPEPDWARAQGRRGQAAGAWLAELARGLVLGQPLSGDEVFSVAPDGVTAIRLREGLRTRTDGFLALEGEVQLTPEPRRRHGRGTGQNYGPPGRELLRVRGEGLLHVRVPGHRLVPLELGEEGVYLREQAAYAFEESVMFENGSLSDGDALELGVVHLRGAGRILLELEGELRTVAVTEGVPVGVELSRLVGWLGEVAPQLLPAVTGLGARVVLKGRGFALLDAAARGTSA